MKYITIIAFLLINLLLSHNSVCQSPYALSEKWSFNVNIGASDFFGDLVDDKNRTLNPFDKYFFEDMGTIGGFMVTKGINPVFSLRGQFQYGNVKSTKESIGQYFKTDVIETSLCAKININNLFTRPEERTLNVYGILGIGFSYFRAKKWDIESNKLIGENGSREVGRTTELIYNLGLGVDCKLPNNLFMFFEFGSKIFNSDKLDVYESSDRSTEGYYFTSIGIGYKFHVVAFATSKYRVGGRTNDSAIRKYNKKKHVVMKTKQHKKSQRYMKKRRKNFKKRKLRNSK